MGSRTQVLIKDAGVYLYDHWGADGDAIVKTLHTAFSRPGSLANPDPVLWDSPEQMAAFIFRNMVKRDPKEEMLFGIGTSPIDDVRLLIIVNCGSQTITVVRDPREPEGQRCNRKRSGTCSFREFRQAGLKAFRKPR